MFSCTNDAVLCWRFTCSRTAGLKPVPHVTHRVLLASIAVACVCRIWLDWFCRSHTTRTLIPIIGAFADNRCDARRLDTSYATRKASRLTVLRRDPSARARPALRRIYTCILYFGVFPGEFDDCQNWNRKILRIHPAVQHIHIV